MNDMPLSEDFSAASAMPVTEKYHHMNVAIRREVMALLRLPDEAVKPEALSALRTAVIDAAVPVEDPLITQWARRHTVESFPLGRQEEMLIKDGVDAMMDVAHGIAVVRGWWNDLKTGESLIGRRNMGEMLMLKVSELGEAIEGHRKGLQDDHLPNRSSLEVELADCLVLIFDTAAAHSVDLPGAFIDKCRYNLKREDHVTQRASAPAERHVEHRHAA